MIFAALFPRRAHGARRTITLFAIIQEKGIQFNAGNGGIKTSFVWKA
jgi:hypothetical protein